MKGAAPLIVRSPCFSTFKFFFTFKIITVSNR
jgi:hypothetical protein